MRAVITRVENSMKYVSKLVSSTRINQKEGDEII
jgi:hypothetical protein